MMRKVNTEIWSYSAEERNLLSAATNSLSELWRFRFLFVLMVKNRITDRYHGSVLGVAWSLLNPLLTMLGLVVVFPLIAKFSIQNYTVYLLSGIVCWTFLSNSLIMGGDCYLASRGLIKSVYMPSLLLPFVFVTAELIGLIFSIVAVLFLCFLFGLSMHLNIALLLTTIFLVYFFGIGIASVMAVLVTNFRDIQHIMGVMLQTIFYLSAIIYPVSILPRNLQFWMNFNVFHHYINLFQLSIYGGTGEWEAIILAMCSSFSIFVLGIVINVGCSRNIVFRL